MSNSTFTTRTTQTNVRVIFRPSVQGGAPRLDNDQDRGGGKVSPASEEKLARLVGRAAFGSFRCRKERIKKLILFVQKKNKKSLLWKLNTYFLSFFNRLLTASFKISPPKCKSRAWRIILHG